MKFYSDWMKRFKVTSKNLGVPFWITLYRQCGLLKKSIAWPTLNSVFFCSLNQSKENVFGVKKQEIEEKRIEEEQKRKEYQKHQEELEREFSLSSSTNNDVDTDNGTRKKHKKKVFQIYITGPYSLYLGPPSKKRPTYNLKFEKSATPKRWRLL